MTEAELVVGMTQQTASTTPAKAVNPGTKARCSIGWLLLFSLDAAWRPAGPPLLFFSQNRNSGSGASPGKVTRGIVGNFHMNLVILRKEGGAGTSGPRGAVDRSS